MSQYQFQYQLPRQLVSTRIWIRPVNSVALAHLAKNLCLDFIGNSQQDKNGNSFGLT